MKDKNGVTAEVGMFLNYELKYREHQQETIIKHKFPIVEGFDTLCAENEQGVKFPLEVFMSKNGYFTKS